MTLTIDAGTPRDMIPAPASREAAMRKNPSLAAVAGAAAMLFGAGLNGATAQSRSSLDIYVVDVEGGNATL